MEIDEHSIHLPDVSLTLPLTPDLSYLSTLPQVEATIWGEKVQAYVFPQGKFKEFLGTNEDLELLMICKPREVGRNAEGLGAKVGFADAYPIHLITEPSADALNAKLFLDIIPRFRANIVLKGTRAWEEDDWTKVKIGRNVFHVVSRMVRCAVPNVDQTTAALSREPFSSMTRFRRIDTGSKYPCFGMSLVSDGAGEINVGDTVEILSTGEHRYIPIQP